MQFECILNINLHHCDKIKDYPHVDHSLNFLFTFNTLEFVYGDFFLFW
jgi:hypothetical protein